MEAEFFGEKFVIERIGTDGDVHRFSELVNELDGKVDALCFGGMDIWLQCGKRRYTIREAWQLAQQIKYSPVVDGSYLKDTLEREALHWLQTNGVVNFFNRKVLLVSAVDRFGMADELWKLNSDLRIGDLAFGLGVPIFLKSRKVYETVGALLLPILTQLPISWIYPTGESQERIKPKFSQLYDWAEVIAGDFLLIRRHLPLPTPHHQLPLHEKIILTNTTTQEDVTLLKHLGVKLLITTTPELEGRTFGTNVIEGVIVAHLQRHPDGLNREDFLKALKTWDWQPNVKRLSP